MDLISKLEQLSPGRLLANKLGEIIFSKRIELGISQDELAKKANLKREVIHRIEAGSDISINEFEKAANSLDINQKDMLWAISTLL
ncbi:helix-turn-helix transcriptional regulator [Priestia megaterium]|uniref:helix-turn-helix domain-containing protein n=1 Tax=Priestia megaterium TaxID=1404 RepID=UPI002E1AEB56|nr:helix-turn-helix transcriptional regulator [Priestia megaterium]